MKVTHLGILFLLIAPAGADEPLTLEQVFQNALKRSELVGTQVELVNQAEEHYKQAKSQVFPQITGSANHTVQETPPGGTASNISPSEQTTVKVTADQPLFRGLKEFATIEQQNLLVTSAMANKRQTEAQLYTDAATNFYLILQLEQDLRDIQDEIEAYQKRIADLNARIKIGRSRDTEVLTVKSAMDTLVAAAEGDRGQLVAAREGFAFLTGLDRGLPLRETEAGHLAAEPMDTYLQHLEERPDVKAAVDSLSATEKNVAIARAGHFPSVDVIGDYYFVRPGLLANSVWDAQLTATLPIFQGGLVNSQVREAASQVRQSDLNLVRVRRLADQDIRTSYANFTADIAQVQLLDRATQTAVKNFEAQNRDYKLGLVTNLDVLTSITTAQESQRALDKAKFQLKLDHVKLLIATAQLPGPKFYGEEVKK
jgi:outer membrane protein